MASVQLYPYQEAHLNVMKGILDKSPIAMDLSMLGTGKTYTSSKLAIDMGLRMVVIAPVSVKLKWQSLQKELNLPIDKVISFCELRSVKCRQPKHGYLHRRDYTVDMNINGQIRPMHRVDFTVTDAFKDLVQKGVLLIVDETQNIKNVSSQFEACKAMIHEIIKSNTRSRALLVSGSPIDKATQTVNVMRCLNILKSESLCTFNVALLQYDFTGMNEVVDFCRRLDQKKCMELGIGPYMSFTNKDRCVALCYRLFQKVLKPTLSHAMNQQPNTAKLVKQNGFFKMNEEDDKTLLRQGINRLSTACSFNPETGMVDMRGDGALGNITHALMIIETAKIRTFSRLATETLFKDPNRKVVICVNYSATLEDLKGMLDAFNPLVLQGSMAGPARQKTICDFQKPTNEHRLLICNTSMCNAGIDLDDKDGRFPRTVFVSPFYNGITLYQLCHRFQRMDTKSDAEINMVYIKDIAENRIIKSLSKKGSVMKETTEGQVQAGVLFPGDFPDFNEL